jgi:hypothetical protein
MAHKKLRNFAPLLNEGTFIREYSTIRPIGHISFTSFQCLLKSSLIVEYSRMQVTSLSSGAKLRNFFVRHIVYNSQDDDSNVSMSMYLSNSQDEYHVDAYVSHRLTL